jgi:hypothetical protein
MSYKIGVLNVQRCKMVEPDYTITELDISWKGLTELRLPKIMMISS